MLGFREVDIWSRHHEIHAMRGQITASCLWNACRIMTLGVLLVGLGVVMATIGKQGARGFYHGAEWLLGEPPRRSTNARLIGKRCFMFVSANGRRLSWVCGVSFMEQERSGVVYFFSTLCIKLLAGGK